MQKFPSQRGFSLIELMVVVAIIGILAAITGPQVKNYIRREDTRKAVRQVASQIQEGRDTAMSLGRMTFVMLDASTNGDGGDAAGDLGFDADQNQIGWLIVDDDADRKPTAADSIRPLFAPPSVGGIVKFYRADSDPPPPFEVATLPDADMSGADAAPSLGYLTDANTLPSASTYAQPAITFTAQGAPINATNPDALGEWGSGAGGIYLTDGVDSVFAVLVMPLGEIKVMKYESTTETWN